MSPATAVFFQPVARMDHLERLLALAPGPEVTPDLWTEVHAQVQGQLAVLENEVRQKVAGVRVSTGRTKGEQFFLFSYRTFSVPDSALDPVVAGMTFTLAHQRVNVEADISGEGTGDLIVPVTSRTVASSREELLGAARESARELCQSAEAIAAALKDPSRRVE
jgi:hypothetical protein